MLEFIVNTFNFLKKGCFGGCYSKSSNKIEINVEDLYSERTNGKGSGTPQFKSNEGLTLNQDRSLEASNLKTNQFTLGQAADKTPDYKYTTKHETVSPRHKKENLKSAYRDASPRMRTYSAHEINKVRKFLKDSAF